MKRVWSREPEVIIILLPFPLLPFAPYLPNPQKAGLDSTCPFTDKSILWTYSKTSGLRSPRTV